jgi:flagellin
MALGVLNNLSAIYAENNLNNTNTSLQIVLQQLSSGSKINSGADDAAGLSLVNGLGANSSALTQSETNATEGVGLLQVADGALSQVTSLLNRAITLATEASNGTLNSTQEGAANQEYQSILSEVNNIGQTTTYNQQQVFNGQQVAIYTGDSSAAGSSIDQLNIRALSEASMGDTGGVMAYSDGSNSVFINLSHTNAITGGVTNAQATDTLNGSGQTTIKVNYLVKGANGTGTLKVTNDTAAHGGGYTASAAYSTGLSSSSIASGTAIYDSSSGQTNTLAGMAGIVSNSSGSSGVATISYSDGAGQALNGTDLSNQTDAETALNDLNLAISDVASQDGYIGAQINTLNSISQVMSTQQENVVSAQNAIQATDYASATSNMSKYEILSQTGIAALAQANSVQQEVTKLLQ